MQQCSLDFVASYVAVAAARFVTRHMTQIVENKAITYKLWWYRSSGTLSTLTAETSVCWDTIRTVQCDTLLIKSNTGAIVSNLNNLHFDIWKVINKVYVKLLTTAPQMWAILTGSSVCFTL